MAETANTGLASVCPQKPPVMNYGSAADIENIFRLMVLSSGQVSKGLDHCIYVIAPSSGMVSKVGYSCNPKRRLDSLQTAHYELLSVKYLFWLPESTALKIERLVLKKAKDSSLRLAGEWVNLFPADAAQLICDTLVEFGAEAKTSKQYLEDYKAALEAHRAHDEEWPSNVYSKVSYSEFRARAKPF